ncbi:hypothetical protein K491DRAFT_721527 [Lophiostoma macrostomum CBS 122681]|uniref:Rhodopsin domain-containing protein n=1 Tax=Lophiostoma macrostomum CBS 122681 TaxID=1314788 RepID=A0A6A6SPY9_9PLEO|nr:hypothetical protein K491DRAFT_721527 [Lophiostoma macrostomum CBS 122681]
MTTPRDVGLALAIISSILLISAWVTVALRVLVRRSIAAYGLDDTFMVGGLWLYTLACVFCILGSFNGLSAPKDMLAAYDNVQGRKCFLFFQIFYVSCTAPIKTSICIALLRINTKRSNRSVLIAILAVAIASVGTTVVGILIQAQPLSAFWTGKGKITDPTLILCFSYAFSAASVTTDFSLGIMPIVILRHLQMPSLIKVSLIFVLALGIIPSLATMVRLRFLTAYVQDDSIHGFAAICIYSIVEAGLGIIAGSLPALRPLLKTAPCSRSHASKSAPSKPREPSRGLLRRITTGLSKPISQRNTGEDPDFLDMIRGPAHDLIMDEAPRRV